MTPEQINSLTEGDVWLAKEHVAEARKTRSGVSTIDFHLCQVDGTTRTLDMAKEALHNVLADSAATAFIRMLRQDLMAEEYILVLRRNRMEPAGSRTCHSHDFVDANMLMMYAIEEVTGKEVVVDSEEYIVLHNKAWEVASASLR